MILFTADWHIKLGNKNVPREWAVNRYNMLFDQVSTLETEVSMHIIGGDLFDRLPSMDELELYFNFVRGRTVQTVIYPGNHEATTKHGTFLTQLKKVTNLINPLVHIIDFSYFDKDFGFHILPYNELHKKGSIEALDDAYPIFTHVRGEIPPHVKPEVDLERFADFPIIFSGDLHSHSNSQRNIVYPGSPVTTSFHRSEVDTGYLLIDPSNWAWEWQAFDLPQLLRRTVSSKEEMVKTEFHHTIYELEGDLADLATVDNTDLLDKKIVRRAAEASLVLDKSMSVEQELEEYLLYVLELDNSKLPEILKVFNDITANTQMG